MKTAGAGASRFSLAAALYWRKRKKKQIPRRLPARIGDACWNFSDARKLLMGMTFARRALLGMTARLIWCRCHGAGWKPALRKAQRHIKTGARRDRKPQLSRRAFN